MLTEVTINISVFAHLLQLTKDKKNCSFIVFHNAFRDNFAFQVNFLFFGEQKMGRGGQSVWLIYLNVTIVIAYIHLGETSYPILPVYEKLTYYL